MFQDVKKKQSPDAKRAQIHIFQDNNEVPQTQAGVREGDEAKKLSTMFFPQLVQCCYDFNAKSKLKTKRLCQVLSTICFRCFICQAGAHSST